MNSPTIFNVRSAVLSDLRLSDFYFASERVVFYLGSLFVPAQLKGTLNKDELVVILRAIKPSFPWYAALSKVFLVQSLKRILNDKEEVSN